MVTANDDKTLMLTGERAGEARPEVGVIWSGWELTPVFYSRLDNLLNMAYGVKR